MWGLLLLRNLSEAPHFGHATLSNFEKFDVFAEGVMAKFFAHYTSTL